MKHEPIQLNTSNDMQQPRWRIDVGRLRGVFLGFLNQFGVACVRSAIKHSCFLVKCIGGFPQKTIPKNPLRSGKSNMILMESKPYRWRFSSILSETPGHLFRESVRGCNLSDPANQRFRAILAETLSHLVRDYGPSCQILQAISSGTPKHLVKDSGPSCQKIWKILS